LNPCKLVITLDW